MSISLSISNRIATNNLVVGLSRDGQDLKIESGNVQIDQRFWLDALEKYGARGANDEVIKLVDPKRSNSLIVFTGLGDAKKVTNETIRRAAGSAARALFGAEQADFALPHKSANDLSAICEGALLGSYLFMDFFSKVAAEKKSPLLQINVISRFTDSELVNKVIKRSLVIFEQTTMVRDLINTPPSHLTPESFCLRITQLCKDLPIKAQTFKSDYLLKNGYGGIIGVGKGSANPPAMLHLSYEPKISKSSKSNPNLKRYAFVGKGITFDTGGLALKPAQGMEAMKSDMSGAAAVVAATIAIAKLNLPIAIDAWAPLAENMVSDNATRPSDVIKIYGGKTVEVLNPDAEGRLVLADAIVKATEVAEKSGGLDGLVDVATLTGAQVVALGTRTSAVMTNNEDFSDLFLTAADISGEQFWPMPLPEELRASLDSPTADIANIGERMGGMLVAGLFLKEFVKPETPWLHLDIAGPAYNEKTAHGYTPVGGTGIAVRSLITLAELAVSHN